MVLLSDISIDTLTKVGIVAAVFCGLALLLAILILVISRVCKIETDEKLEKVLEKLAGANCGGCGCSGCAGFAEKLCKGESSLSDCHVTSPESKQEIAEILGVEIKNEERTVACVMCSGGANAVDLYDYNGITTCVYQAQLFNGSKMCNEGCLGFGTCMNTCPEHAISIKDNVASVNPDACISCGLCINSCPKKLIERIPAKASVYVACSSHCKGKEVISACKAGCIGCGLCVKNCPAGAITMENNLPKIDYTKCTGCLTCTAKCPRKVIKVRVQ
ncbi:MAG: 4Fe-4S binding protein [Clostridia bacterium]|nr:4Fe-4S binding protein [Clostridia bacterium]